jgi:AcrR family transcriptional regulator
MPFPRQASKPLTRLRKRPEQKRSKATFAVILEAAARILAAAGPEGLTTNRIATKAGVSVGSLYQYFPNKEAIARALMEREIDNAESVRPVILDDLETPLERRVEALVNWRIDARLRNAALADSLRKLADLVLGADERARFERYRRDRTWSTLRTWLAGQDRDVEAAAYLVDSILTSVVDSATERDEARLKLPSFRHEIAALLSRYLERPNS